LKSARKDELPAEPATKKASRKRSAPAVAKRTTTKKAAAVKRAKKEPAQVTILKPRRGRPPAKHSDPAYTQVTAYILKDTHRDVKIALLRSKEPMEFSELVEWLLAGWLKNPK